MGDISKAYREAVEKAEHSDDEDALFDFENTKAHADWAFDIFQAEALPASHAAQQAGRDANAAVNRGDLGEAQAEISNGLDALVKLANAAEEVANAANASTSYDSDSKHYTARVQISCGFSHIMHATSLLANAAKGVRRETLKRKPV